MSGGQLGALTFSFFISLLLAMLVVIIGTGFGNQRAVYVVATYLTIAINRLIIQDNDDGVVIASAVVTALLYWSYRRRSKQRSNESSS